MIKIAKRLLVLTMLVPHFAFAEDVFFRVVEATPAWLLSVSPLLPNNNTAVIEEGTIVQGGTWPLTISGPERVLANIPFLPILHNNRELRVYANSLVPAETQDLFDAALLYDPERPLVSSFYLNALRLNDRELVRLQHEGVWNARMYSPDRSALYDPPPERWYEENTGGRQNLFITQASLGFDTNEKYDSTLLIRNIERTGEGYRITARVGFSGRAYSEWWAWSNFEGGELFTLLLIPDGDYIDLYLGSRDNRIDTFAFVDREFLTQVTNLLRIELTNTPVDMSKITFWPRRADGSMDYPPLEGVNLDFRAGDKERGELALPIRLRDRQSRSQTTDRLRVRENPDTSSAIVTTLDTGTGVQVLETGATETIGGITAPWVKVLAENGFTGWAFSGYLETQNQESTNKEPENVDSENLELENVETRNLDSINANPTNLERENVETQNPEAADQDLANGNPPNPEPENKKSGFPVLPFAVTGGVILVSGIAAIVVFAVLAKRRKGKAAKP